MPDDDVLIEQTGGTPMIKPVKQDWEEFFNDPNNAPEYFLRYRNNDLTQDRDIFRCICLIPT